MKIAVQRLNNSGITIEKALLDKALFKYTSIYSKYCYLLYDLGYQSSPSVFNKQEFRTALYQSFPKEHHVFMSYMDAVFMFDIDVADYAIAKYKGNKEFVKVVTYYRNILKASNALKALNKAFNKMNIKKKAEVVIKPRLSVSNTVADYSVYPLDEPAIQECFKRNPDTYLKYVDTRHILIKYLCFEVGVTEEEYRKHYLTGQPFFLSGVTQKEELNFVNLISAGSIELDGKYGKLLEEKISNYYKNNSVELNSRLSCVDFGESIFVKSLDERLALTTEARREFEPIGAREFYVTRDYVVLEVPNMVNKKKASYFKDGFIVGNFVMNYVSEAELDKSNMLMGLSGEYITKKDVERLGYYTDSKPVYIHHLVPTSSGELKDELTEFYSIAAVRYSDEKTDKNEFVTGTLKPRIGSQYEVTPSDYNKMLEANGVSDKRELFNLVYTNVDTHFNISCGKQSYARLVADLTCALVFMECGFPEYELVYDSYEFVTDDIFSKACYDAENMFKDVEF